MREKNESRKLRGIHVTRVNKRVQKIENLNKLINILEIVKYFATYLLIYFGFFVN